MAANVAEDWRDIDGFPGYQVSQLGGVRRVLLDRIRPLKTFRGGGGYRCVNIYRNKQMIQFKVHTLVLTAFAGACPRGMEARHFPDADRMNAALSNLSWATRSQNMADKLPQGTYQGGDASSARKLSSADVSQIRANYGFVSSAVLARTFGVGRTTIYEAINRKTWKYA